MKRFALFLILVCLLPANADRRAQLVSQKPAAAGGSGSTLNDGLVLLWKLDEGSGATRVATVGGLDLADNGTVGQTMTVPANFTAAASFDGVNDFLSHADDSALRMGDFDDHWVAWVYPSANLTMMAVAKDDNGQRGYLAYVTGTLLTFDSVTNGCANFKEAQHGTSVSLNTWYMMDWGYDKTGGNKYFVNFNAGTRATTVGGYPCSSTTADFNVGRRAYPGFENRWNGAICYVMRWNRILTGAELTELYNSGNGKPYPF